MKWLEKCETALIDAHIFLSHQHLVRFHETFHLLKEQPFVNKGLIKCAFLAAWDQGHFNIFMNSVTECMKHNDTNLNRMIKNSADILENAKASEQVLYELSQEFLLHPDETPSESFLMKLSTLWIAIADSTLEASYIIDKL